MYLEVTIKCMVEIDDEIVSSPKELGELLNESELTLIINDGVEEYEAILTSAEIVDHE